MKVNMTNIEEHILLNQEFMKKAKERKEKNENK